MKIEVELTAEDLAMVETIKAWKRAHPHRTPRKHEIVFAYWQGSGRADMRGGRVFERLVLLGVIDHKRNGYCWLSEAFKEKAGVTA